MIALQGREPTIDGVADAVADRGWCVTPGFLDEARLAQMEAEARALWEEGAFRRAGVGRGAELTIRPEVRQDWVLWLDREPDSPALAAYLERIEGLRRAINERMYLGLFDFEAHLTVYPPGAFYRRHLDRFRSAPGRTVSVILYLNRDWEDRDGGAMRLYLNGEDGGEHLDVPPDGGTLVTFLSDRFWHEVLPARRERMSLTGWLKKRA